MYKSYRFRMYPTISQIELIHKTFGCTRLVYNYYLEKKKEANLSCFDMIKDLKKLQAEHPYLKEVDSCSLRCSLFNLDDAFKRYYKKQGSYPKFKSKYNSRRCYRTNCISSSYKDKTYQSIEVNLKKDIIKLPKLKEVKIRGYRDLEYLPGRIINATVEQASTGKYYVSVVVEENDIYTKLTPRKIIGIDLGIKDIIITSDNEKIGNPRLIEKYEKRIKRCQRELSRRIKRSNNYYKTKRRLAVLYQKLKNARKYLIHQITKKLVIENDIIVTENLNIKGMIEEKKISKHLTNVSLGEICRVLEYKAKIYGKKYIQIDSYYPSSQICSKCGYKNKEVKKLSVRSWVCPKCESNHDRDYNASYNILFEGLKKYIKQYI
ncbi:MAG: RNA-guided endonuclease TnpB family protein [Bacilli bacterium]|nr:RNA-guided endonuclease TnpB family protein [Bacilli bacterium]